MIRTLLFVLAAALVVAGAVWIAGYPGDVRFTVAGWEIAAPVPLVAACVLLIAIAAALLYRLWRSIRKAPADMRGWLYRRRRERGYRALTHGMVAVAAGDAEEARRQAQRADSLLGEPPLTMLLSAQAAQLNGDEDAARRYFTAMLEREETAFLGLRGLLIQAQRAGDRGEALRLAQRAHALRPKTPWVLTTLLDLQVAERNWREALGTLEQAIRRGAIAEARGRHLRAVLLLGCSQAADAAGDRDSAFGYARKAQGQQPDYLPATLHLAAMSAAAGRRRATLRLIEDAWARTPHPALAELYAGLGDESDALKIVRRIEALAARNPDHAESHIAVGRAMMDAQIWGASRSHLEAAAGSEPSARICRLMAELEERERGDLAASHDWLLRAANAAPDPAWICSACGAAFARWTPVCDCCGALGTQDWKVPARARAIEADGPAPALPAAATGNGEAPRPPEPSPPATRPPGQPAPAE